MVKKTFEPIFLPSSEEQFHVSKLPNGMSVVLESPQVPNYVSLMVLYKFGIKNESSKGSGYLQWLRNSILSKLNKYPKVLSNTQIDIDKECTIVKSACMAYQVEEFLEAIASCFQPSVLDRSVLDSMKYDQDADNDIKELLQEAAFAGVGKGKPSAGFKNNFEMKDALFHEGKALHKKGQIASNFVIVGSGIYNKAMFLKLVQEKFGFMKAASDEELEMWNVLDKSQTDPYVGGLKVVPRHNTAKQIHFDDEDLEAEQIGMVFPTLGITDPKFYDLTVLETLIGESSYFSTGGPGKGMNALAVSALRSCNPATHVLTYKQAYKNSSLFGVIFKGVAGSSEQLFSHLLKLFQNLHSNIKAEDFERAKNITKSTILMNLEGQHARAEEIAANFFNYDGDMRIKEYAAMIDRVTIGDVKDVVRIMLSQKPTIVGVGKFNWLSQVKINIGSK